MDARRLAQRHASTARTVVEDQCESLEDLILSSRAYDAADALVQVMVASARLDLLATASTERSEIEEKRLWRALQGATKALAGATGVKLADVGGRFYASTWCDPWPDIDLSDLPVDDGVGCDVALDGTGAGTGAA